MVQSDFTISLLATVDVLVDSARKASSALWKNWIIIPASLALYMIFAFVAPLFLGLGIVGGFIAGFLYIALLTLYYRWVKSSISGSKLSFNKYMLDFDSSLFWGLISIGFLLWILSGLANPLASTHKTLALYWCVKLAIFFLLNPVPEVAYISQYQSLYAFKHSIDFVKENWVEWFVPLIVLFAPILYFSPVYLLISAAGADPFMGAADPLLPTQFVFSRVLLVLRVSFPSLHAIGFGISLVIANWFMLFRGYLYTTLERGTRRKRIYEYKQKYSQ